MSNKKKKKNEKVYRSIAEIEGKFFPKSYKSRKIEKPRDAGAMGVVLARTPLNRINSVLAERLDIA